VDEVVVMWNVETKLGEPLDGVKEHVVLAGQPVTPRATGPVDAPRTLTFAVVTEFGVITAETGSTETT